MRRWAHFNSVIAVSILSFGLFGFDLASACPLSNRAIIEQVQKFHKALEESSKSRGACDLCLPAEIEAMELITAPTNYRYRPYLGGRQSFSSLQVNRAAQERSEIFDRYFHKDPEPLTSMAEWAQFPIRSMDDFETARSCARKLQEEGYKLDGFVYTVLADGSLRVAPRIVEVTGKSANKTFLLGLSRGEPILGYGHLRWVDEDSKMQPVRFLHYDLKQDGEDYQDVKSLGLKFVIMREYLSLMLGLNPKKVLLTPSIDDMPSGGVFRINSLSQDGHEVTHHYQFRGFVPIPKVGSETVQYVPVKRDFGPDIRQVLQFKEMVRRAPKLWKHLSPDSMKLPGNVIYTKKNQEGEIFGVIKQLADFFVIEYQADPKSCLSPPCTLFQKFQSRTQATLALNELADVHDDAERSERSFSGSSSSPSQLASPVQKSSIVSSSATRSTLTSSSDEYEANVVAPAAAGRVDIAPFEVKPDTIRQPIVDEANARAGGRLTTEQKYEILKAEAISTQERLIRLLHRISSGTDAKVVQPNGPNLGIKSDERAMSKIQSEFGGDVARLRDISRATLQVESPRDVFEAVKLIQTSPWRIVAGKNRFTKPKANGYRDINLVVEDPRNRVRAEVQIQLRGIQEQKEVEHILYGVVQDIERKGMRITAEDKELLRYLGYVGKSLYDGALMKSVSQSSLRRRPKKQEAKSQPEAKIESSVH